MAKLEGNRFFQVLGRESGCREFTAAFYARVANDAELRPLFPGKTLRCATEEFAAFLIQFFDGDENESQFRWWLSLRESHARFQVSGRQRDAWLRCMFATIDSLIEDLGSRDALKDYFASASSYVVHANDEPIADQELARCWSQQLSLDQVVEKLSRGQDENAIELARVHASRRSVFVGILARLLKEGRKGLIEFVLASLERDPGLAHSRFNGRFMLHFAAASGSLPVVRVLLAGGVDADVLDSGNHTPLYRVANGCNAEVGADIARELVRAGANVDACGGVTHSTPLHAAARHGHLSVLQALLDLGASTSVRDTKGFTPLDRAINCRRAEAARYLKSHQPII